MADIDDDTLTANPTAQERFVQLAQDVFSGGSDVARTAFAKLRSFMNSDREIEGLFQSAQAGTLAGGFEDLFERTRRRVVDWDLSAIFRGVVMPLASGYLAYALVPVEAAGAAAGAAPVLIGFLVGAVVWLAMYPSAISMLKQKISEALDDMFRPWTK